jgi:CheY-like chemotaxis protein
MPPDADVETLRMGRRAKAPQRRAPRVLLAEDDVELRSSLTRLLKLEGYEVLSVATGGQMLQRVSAWVLGRNGASMPDVIITDVRMPGISGLSIVQGLRASGWRQPIIVMSAFGDDELRNEVSTIERTEFLDKPIEPAELRAMLARLLD